MRRFARCYIAVCECLREEEDLRRLVREVAEDSAKSGATVALAERRRAVWWYGGLDMSGMLGAFWIEPALSLELYAERLGGLPKL